MVEREPTEQKEITRGDHSPRISSYPGIPRWLKLSAIVAIILILLFGILHLTANHNMGPGMHMPSTAQGTAQP